MHKFKIQMTFNLIDDNITYNELCFGTPVKEKILPFDKNNIPTVFLNSKTKWSQYTEIWDRQGLEKDTKIIPKMGINKEVVIKKLTALMNSRHFVERTLRLAAAAYIMSVSFENISFKDPKSSF